MIELVRQTLTLLESQTPETLSEQGTQDLPSLQAQLGFDKSFPSQPDLPPAPQAYTPPPAPHEDDPKYAVTLTGLDKFLSSRRIKKENVALRKFEKDRKAWDEDRLNGIAMYTFASKNHAREVEALNATYLQELEAWQAAFITYLRNQAA